jgi:uncharacterized coiled-coil protein SlyX
MGKIEDLKNLLAQIQQDSRSTAQQLDSLTSKLRKSQGTANEVGGQLGRSLAHALAESEKQAKQASQALSQLAQKAQQEAQKLP